MTASGSTTHYVIIAIASMLFGLWLLMQLREEIRTGVAQSWNWLRASGTIFKKPLAVFVLDRNRDAGLHCCTSVTCPYCIPCHPTPLHRRDHSHATITSIMKGTDTPQHKSAKKPDTIRSEHYWVVFMTFALAVVEVASYIPTGHFVFPFCRYACFASNSTSSPSYAPCPMTPNI